MATERVACLHIGRCVTINCQRMRYLYWQDATGGQTRSIHAS